MRFSLSVGSLLLALLSVPAAFAADPTDVVVPPQHSGWSFSEARGIPVQAGGRLKPLDSFARELTLTITGSRSFEGWQPLDLVFSWISHPSYWDQKAFITIARPDVRRQLGLDETRRHYSPRELYQDFALMQYAQNLSPGGEANTTTGGPQAPKAGAREQELRRLLDRLGAYREVVSGGAWTIIPLDPKTHPNGAWAPLNAPDKSIGQAIRASFADALHAYQAMDEKAFDRATLLTRKAIEGELPSGWSEGDGRKISIEVLNNRVRPFLIAWILYLVAALTWLVSGSPSRELSAARGAGSQPKAPTEIDEATSRRNRRSAFARRAALGLTALAFLTQVTGIAFRCYIAGRPPVTNMYESIVWVMLGVMIFASILYWVRKQPIVLVVACSLATVGLIAADANPAMIGSGLDPLVPVLRSNFWLTIHVLTITLGYAAFTLTLGLADVTMYQFLRRKTGFMARVNELNQLTYRATQFGVVLLAAGTILGGVWADYSWGRFWGWDPKETWALIALLSYVAILHGRLTNWMGQFAFPAWTIVGFLSVLMAWYGVNFILGAGLHSYGFSTGGLGWVIGFTVLELGYVGVAALVHRRQAQVARTPVAAG